MLARIQIMGVYLRASMPKRQQNGVVKHLKF
jgi:hypothetical protein